MRVVWRWVLGPLIAPVLYAPFMILGSVLRPLQAIAVALISLAYLWSPWAALGVGVLHLVGYAYYALSAPRDPAVRELWARNQQVPGGQAATIALNAGIGIALPAALLLLPEFNSFLRWGAAVFTGYYVGAVLSTYIAIASQRAIQRQLIHDRLQR